jgi:leucyl-tRNA synthetase
MPVDIYVGGMEHAIMHLLYARFIHKFCCDYYGIKDIIEERRHPGHSIREPFKELIVQGLVKGKAYQLKSQKGKYIHPDDLHKYSEDELVSSFEKMSKSKGTGIAPRIMAQKYGVDTLRMAIMFGAPPENDLNFDEAILQNMKSFLDRVAKCSESFVPNTTHGPIDLKHKDF